MNHVLKGKWITRTRIHGGKLTKLKYRTKKRGAFRIIFMYVQAIVQEAGIVEDILLYQLCNIVDFNTKKWVK